MSKPLSSLNTEFDSRIVRVSSGPAGVTRPRILLDNRDLERVWCLHCGKPGGATTRVPPAAKGDPGMIYICLDCDGKLGSLPTHATSLVRYKES